jgi:hypothetical protein
MQSNISINEIAYCGGDSVAMILMSMRLGRGCEGALVEAGIFANLIGGRRAREVCIPGHSNSPK